MMALEEIFNYTLLFLSLVCIVITAGVVWRVEKKLDVSFKFFLIAIIVFTIGIFFDILEFYSLLPAWDFQKIIKAVFILLFSIGMYEMRSLVIRLENIKEKNKE